MPLSSAILNKIMFYANKNGDKDRSAKISRNQSKTAMHMCKIKESFLIMKIASYIMFKHSTNIAIYSRNIYNYCGMPSEDVDGYSQATLKVVSPIIFLSQTRLLKILQD